MNNGLMIEHLRNEFKWRLRVNIDFTLSRSSREYKGSLRAVVCALYPVCTVMFFKPQFEYYIVSVGFYETFANRKKVKQSNAFDIISISLSSREVKNIT